VRRQAAILASAVLLLAAACGGGEEASPTAETVEGTVPTQTAEQVGEGNAKAGKEIFAAQGCGSCHTFSAAGSSGTTGPDLDKALQGKDAEYVHESIVDPNAETAEGFPPGIMPQDYGEKLSEKQLADLVAFLTKG
jgi:mono/diheme cytochrome c family protein